MKNNIALIGFMGTGKTAVSSEIARISGRKLINIDSIIEQRAGKSISHIFEQDGEIAFREIEIEVVKEIAEDNNQVIDCGGGVVLNWVNIQRLKNNAVIVLLTADINEIINRTGTANERPLLRSGDLENRIEDLLKFRMPFYERAADLIVDTTGLEAAQVAEKVIGELKKYAIAD
jgi:shikimate kinase